MVGTFNKSVPEMAIELMVIGAIYIYIYIWPGNAHGDFYLHNLYGQDDEGGAVVQSSYQRILGLHKGPIHDLAVGALYCNEEKLG